MRKNSFETTKTARPCQTKQAKEQPHNKNFIQQQVTVNLHIKEMISDIE